MSEEHAKFAVEKAVDESVKARNAQLGNKRYGALGPPDLCQLVRGGGGGLMSRSQEKGACCYCFGTDVSSPATVAAYIVALSSKLSDMRRGTFCAFDAFSNRDVRIELVFPGTVTSHICSIDGTRAGSVSEQMWRRLQVSATLRAMDGLERDRGGLFRPAGKFPISLHNPLATPQGEAAFLKAAESVFWEAHSLGSSGGGTGSHAINLLTSTLLKHFIATRRFATAEAFFSKFRPHDPSVAVLLARSAYHDESANVSRVLGLLAALLIRHRKSVAQLLLIEQAKFLRRAGNLHAATMVAEQAVHAEHGEGNVDLSHEALLQVALCYAEAGDGAKTLAALNVIETGKVEAERPARLSSSMDEAARDGRWPVNPASGGMAAVFRGQPPNTGDGSGSSGSSSSSGGGSGSSSNSGSIGGSGKKGGGSGSGSGGGGGSNGGGTHPFRRTGLQSNVYSCLVNLCNEIGWEGLLDARNQVFHVTTPTKVFGNHSSTPSSPVLTPSQSELSSSGLPGEDTPAYPPSPDRVGGNSGNISGSGGGGGGGEGVYKGDAYLTGEPRAPAPPRPMHKRACARWLDYILVCLHKDLLKLVQYKQLTARKGFGVLTAETAVEAALLSLQLQQPSYAKLCLAEVTGNETHYGGMFFAKILLANQLIQGNGGAVELKLGLKVVHELGDIRRLNIAMSTTLNQKLKHLVMLAVSRHGARKVVEQSKPFGKASLLNKLVREALAWKCQGHDI